MSSTDRNICPNYKTCQLVNPPYLNLDAVKKEIYILSYCHGGKRAWSACKRYVTNNVLNFCPDFVLPDSAGTPEDIINEFDKKLNNNE
jgi:hypothetical protein